MKLFVVFFAALVCLATRGQSSSESETNAVVQAMLDWVNESAVDYLDGSTQAPCCVTWTWDGFLGADETNGWTRAAKKSAFCDYLNFMSTNDNGRLTAVESNRLSTAIRQCRVLSYTNAVPALQRLVLNPTAGYWCGTAIPLAFTMGGIDPDTTALFEFVVTNELRYSIRDRAMAYGSYAKRIRTSGSLFNNGDSSFDGAVLALYKRRSDAVGAMAVDRAISSSLPGYAASTNRFSVAAAILQEADVWPAVRTYFEAVTNGFSVGAESPMH